MSQILNLVAGALIGYVIHDAVQPTAVGKALDKIALPSDLFTSTRTNGVEVEHKVVQT